MSSKVKDGLFLGDIDAAQDAEFLQLNGIVHIVNCVPRQVPNLFQQSLGFSYVTCDLDEVLRRPFFDLKNRQFMGIVQLIDRALERTESVLVHSLNGINRSPSVMIGYLMVKYCWGVDKAYEFLLAKRADIKPHESYIDQLCLLEAQLQSQFGERATEQQLFEWKPSLADLRTDELVLVHTYINSVSALNAKKCGTEAPPKASVGRRLSWIDQVTQLKKLYPSLMIKPERPPNSSYSDMLPADGWIDLIAPGAAAGGSAPAKPIAAFMEPASATSATSTLPAFSAPAPVDHLDGEDTDSASGTRTRRVHSFSVPQRRSEPDVEHSLSPSSSAASDRDEPDLTIEVASGPTPRRSLQPASRYQQQIRGAVNTRPPRQLGSSSTTRPNGSRSNAMASLSGARTVPAPIPGQVSSTTVASTAKGSSAAKPLDLSKPSKPLAKSSSRVSSTTSSKDRRASSGSFSARGALPADLPLPAAFSVRRAVLESSDPWSALPASGAASTRPRTAPPRLRKKDSDASLSSKSMDAVFAGLSRVSIDVAAALPAASAGASSRRLSGSQKPPPATRTSAASASSSASARTRPARAHWK